MTGDADVMDRRTFFSTLGLSLLAAPLAALAQPPRKLARVGWVAIGTGDPRTATFLDALREGMRELGWVEGRNLTLEVRWVEQAGRDRVAQLTAELVRSRVDLLVAQGPAVWGVKAGAGSVPVVFGFSGDPVEAGFVSSLARPGRNLTGITFLSLELAGKRLELLREILPGVSRVAVLANPQHAGEQAELRASQAAARRLGLTLQYVPVRAVRDFDAAFEAMTRERAEAIDAFPDVLIMLQRKAIAEFAARRRIPAISGWADFALDGNLMTYGPILRESWRHIATYVDRILRGARPADLPVQQPSKFELVVNVKTAQTLGLTLPQSVVVRADRVIQ